MLTFMIEYDRVDFPRDLLIFSKGYIEIIDSPE